MRYLSLAEILRLHEVMIESSGGARGIRDIRALESSINQPRLTFNQTDLYPDIVNKAAALCFFLVLNHPFIDGNKRVGHAAMETFLVFNGLELIAPVDEQGKTILELAEGKLNRLRFTDWVNRHIVSLKK
jgi:death on curing protein